MYAHPSSRVEGRPRINAMNLGVGYFVLALATALVMAMC